MPDISMCGSETCAARATCRRNEASGTRPSQPVQAWFWDPPGHDDTCGHYWPTDTPQRSRRATNG